MPSGAERLVTLAVIWQRNDVALAPDLEGLVTAIAVVSGDELESLDDVIAVDGITRIAWHSVEPFHRPLSVDMSGRDVFELQRLLEASELLDRERSGRIDRPTLLAIGALSRELGFEQEQYVFDPAWVIRLEAPVATVGEITARVGSRSPSLGESLIVGPTTIASAELLDEANSTGGCK